MGTSAGTVNRRAPARIPARGLRRRDREASFGLKPLDFDLSGLGRNHDIVIICRLAACVLRSGIHNPDSGIVSAVDKTEPNRNTVW